MAAKKKTQKLTAKELFNKVKALQPQAVNLPWVADRNGKVYAPHRGPMRAIVPVATMSQGDAALTAALTEYFIGVERELDEHNTRMASLENALLLLCDGMKRPWDIEEMGNTPEEAEKIWQLYKDIARKHGYTLHEDKLK